VTSRGWPPFAPEIVLPAIDHCIHKPKLTKSNPYGFKASFNQTHPEVPEIPMAGGSRPGTTGLIKVRLS
jgi:hypothetical protein